MKKSMSLVLSVIMILFTLQTAFPVFASASENPLKEMHFTETSITLNTDSYGVKTKDLSKLLVLTGEDKNTKATYDELEWTSTKKTVAKVSSDGVVTAVGDGECIIKVKQVIYDGTSSSYGLEASCTVTVRDSINKYYNSIEVTKSKLPKDYKDKTKYLPSAVDDIEAVLKEISDNSNLKDTENNCNKIKSLDTQLTKAYATLISSQLIQTGDTEFYDKWNAAYAKIPSDFFKEGVYFESSVTAVNEIIDKVYNPKTPWLDTAQDKAEIDALADELKEAVADAKKHTTKISLNTTSATRSVNGELKLTATVNGADKVTWSTNNKYATEIEGSGKTVTVKINGALDSDDEVVTITATSNGKKATCKIKITNDLASISVPKEKIVYLNSLTEKNATIDYELVGVDSSKPVSKDCTVSWSSSNTSVATVNKTSGKITPKSAGSCTVTLTCDGISAKVNVIVEEFIPVEKFIPSTVGIPTRVTVNSTTTAEVKVWPSTATNKSVKWTSSNKKIATVKSIGVDGSGVASAAITGVKSGTVTITYETTDGTNIKGSFDITVDPLVSSVTLNKSSLVVYIGSQSSDIPKLKATIKPTDAGNQQLLWSSSNTKVATVTNGVITIKSVGTCNIIAYTLDGSGVSGSCKLTVVGDTQKMTLSKSSATLKVGKTLKLSCNVETAKATYKATEWKTSDKSIATVNSSGVVTAKYPGKVTISAVALDGKKTSCTVTVTADLKGVELPNSVTLNIGKEKTLNVTYTPSYATNKKVTWHSSDTSVVTVSSSGKLKAVGKGTATITVKSKDGGFTDTCKVTVVKPVTSVSVSKETCTLTMGKKESVKLTANIKPSDATLKTVTWSTSNKKIATVSKSGIVSAVGPGTVYITVTTTDGGYTAVCKVTVKQPLKSIKFENSKETFYVGKQAKLKLVFNPSNASNKNCTWKSSDKNIATVDSEGKVKAIAVGSCTITAKSKDGGYTATCKLTVTKKVYPTSVKLNYSSKTITAGKTYQLTATVSPKNASVKTVKWSSSDKSIATVNSKGLVTAKKGGTVTITCTTNSGNKKAYCKITVKEKVSSITLSASSVTLVTGKTKTLTATASPSSATDKSVSWSSSDKEIVTVSKGKITAVKAGTAYIKAKAKDGSGVYARCKVTVIQAPKKVKLSLSEATLTRGDKMTLTAKVTPSNSYDKTVTWKSNKTSVAKVSSSGVVTAVKAGTATIICTSSVNDSIKAYCVVTVEEPVKGIELSVDRMTLITGKTKKLSYQIKPSDATNKEVKFTSSNKDIVKVNSKGVVEAVGPGTATVSVRTVDGYYVDKCKVTVIEPVIAIKLNYSSFTLAVAKSRTIDATIKPKNATNQELTWRSSNSTIARVSQSGKVTALKPGTVTITCSSSDGVQATCTVKCVIGVEAVELNRSSMTLEKGKSKTLKATIEPTNATIKDVTWSSSDKSVATVDENGKVKAVKKGTAIITCKTKQGGYKATCVVTVK